MLIVEEKTNLLKEHLRTRLWHDLRIIYLELCWRARPLLIAALTPALRQGFASQSRFVCRPKTPQRFLWKRGLATKAFGCLCPADFAQVCGIPKFDADMRKPAQWVVLPIFSKLALNNAGS
jgi:hypothetical protein